MGFEHQLVGPPADFLFSFSCPLSRFLHSREGWILSRGLATILAKRMPKPTQSPMLKVDIKRYLMLSSLLHCCVKRAPAVVRPAFVELNHFKAAGSVVKCASDGEETESGEARIGEARGRGEAEARRRRLRDGWGAAAAAEMRGWVRVVVGGWFQNFNLQLLLVPPGPRTPSP